MARPILLGNGALTVGIDEFGQVHDFYYPYVGLENLTTARSTGHKIGIWVNGLFSWSDDGNWQINQKIADNALIGITTLVSDSLKVELVFTDFVDTDHNAFIRRLVVTNNSDNEQDIRVFLHQVFEISPYGRADTALFEPDENYILDYKGRCSILTYGWNYQSNKPFDQFAIGNHGIEGKEGTYKDAEDGELSGSAVEHGSVDATIRFKLNISAKNSVNIDYWLVAADSQNKAEKIHLKLKSTGMNSIQQKCEDYWKDWLNVAKDKLSVIPEPYKQLSKTSLMLIKAHCDRRGGIIASCDSSIYNYGRDYYTYVWPRDGAYAVWPLIRLGYSEEARKFFEFCRDIITEEGYLEHKFQPDRAIGSTWHPLLHGNHKELAIQQDETAIVLYMLGEYDSMFKDHEFIENLYGSFIQPMANWLSDFIDSHTGLPHASYDLWEEKFLTNTYTVGVVYQALLTAADFAEAMNYPDDTVKWQDIAEQLKAGANVFFEPNRGILRKGFLLQPDKSLQFDDTLDISSIFGSVIFGLFDKQSHEVSQTLNVIEKDLIDQSPSKGVPRYEYDKYFASEQPYKGNPWFVASFWMAQYYIRIGRGERAKQILDWAHDHKLSTGVLSEQVDPTYGNPVSVTPLVWSHAEFINTALDYSLSLQD
ncbi:MAG: glycoside hydrolase family 15 protein [Patescibacteria group bacterium]